MELNYYTQMDITLGLNGIERVCADGLHSIATVANGFPTQTEKYIC